MKSPSRYCQIYHLASVNNVVLLDYCKTFNLLCTDTCLCSKYGCENTGTLIFPMPVDESAKLRGLRGYVGYVGRVGAWVRGLRGSKSCVGRVGRVGYVGL